MQGSQILILGLALVAMWFLLIRPQQQRQRQHQQTVASLRSGQRIVTIGGLVAEVVEVRDDKVLVKVADGGTMEYMKDAIGRVLPDEPSPVEDADDEELAELPESATADTAADEGEDAE